MSAMTEVRKAIAEIDGNFTKREVRKRISASITDNAMNGALRTFIERGEIVDTYKRIPVVRGNLAVYKKSHLFVSDPDAVKEKLEAVSDSLDLIEHCMKGWVRYEPSTPQTV